jgi:hypothetical protein
MSGAGNLVTDFKPGDRVRGVVTGLYLGEVISAKDEMVQIRTPNGLTDLFHIAWLDLIPADVEGRARVWV